MTCNYGKNCNLVTRVTLLQKLKFSSLSKQELAKECGYYSVTTKNDIHSNLANFYDVVLTAKGIILEPKSIKDGRDREAK